MPTSPMPIRASNTPPVPPAADASLGFSSDSAEHNPNFTRRPLAPTPDGFSSDSAEHNPNFTDRGLVGGREPAQ